MYIFGTTLGQHTLFPTLDQRCPYEQNYVVPILVFNIVPNEGIDVGPTLGQDMHVCCDIQMFRKHTL